MKKVRITYNMKGVIELNVEKGTTMEQVVNQFNDRVGVTEDDLHNNVVETTIFEIVEENLEESVDNSEK
jgi:hypothetical protein